MQLQTKILLLLVPLIVLPILTLGGAAYGLLMDDARDRTQFQMTPLLDQIESSTKSQLRTARANASLFSNTDLIRRYTRTDLPPARKAALEPAILELLFDYQLAYPEYYEIRIVTADGKEQLRSVLGGVKNLTADESATAYFMDISRHPLADATRETVVSIDELATNINRNLPALANNANTALQDAQQALRRVEALLQEDSSQIYNLNIALEEIVAAARSIRMFAETIERQPETLLRGKNTRD